METTTNTTPKAWLTTNQLIDYLGISLWTAKEWRRTGGGPPYHKWGPRTVRYSRVEVDAWASSRVEVQK